MSIKAASLYVDVDANTKPAETKLNAFSGALRNMFTGMAMGVGMGALNALEGAVMGLPAAIGKATQSASDLTETVNMMTVVMGTGAASTIKWSQGAATALGMSQNQALNAAATFATFGKSAGKAGGDLVKFSTGLTGLAADLASFKNTTPEDAITAIGAALRGENEPIRRYGVLLDDATLRQAAFDLHITDSIKNVLTPQQRMLAANAELWRQTSDAQGDVARTGGALAGQQRQLTANMADLSATIGQAFLPAMTSAVTATNQLATSAMPAVKAAAEAMGASIAGVSKDIAVLVVAYDNMNKMFTGPALGGKAEGLGDIILNNLPGATQVRALQQAIALVDIWNQSVAAPTTGKFADDVSAIAPAAAQAAGGLATATQGLTDMQLASWSAALGLDRMTIAAQILSTNMDAMASRMASNRAQIEGIFMGATDLLGAAGAAAGAREADAAFKAYHSTLVANETDPLVIKAKEKVWIDNQNKSFQDQRTALANAERAAVSYASNGVKAIESAYDDLAGKVSGVVGSLTGLSDIAIPGGPRTDAANENARRMAAIANEGIAGQSWLEDFKNEVPQLYADVMAATDPKAFATTWVQDFQAGLHPEALDREMIKTNIRRMILGEETMATYVAEISAEIRAENGLAPAAEAIVTGVTGALTSGNMGAAVGAATVASVNTPAAVVQFHNAGESAFGSWRAGWEFAAGGWNPTPPGGLPGPLPNPAGGAGTTGTLNGKPISQQGNVINVTVSAADNPAAVGKAAANGVLDALRARGR